MTDVRDALEWIREELPSMKLNCPDLKIDGDRVAVVGWSTGGTLALSLGFTPQAYSIKPPEAILAFYCPSNYDDDCKLVQRQTVPVLLSNFLRFQKPYLSKRLDRCSRQGL